MKTLYITDLDGTLLDDNGEITEATKDYIKASVEKGANFTLATARTFATVAEMFKDIELNIPVVLMNGVMLYDLVSNRSIYSHSVDYSAAADVMDAFRRRGLSPLVYYDKGDCLEIKYNNNSNEYQLAYVNNRNHSQGKMFTYSPFLEIEKEDKIIYFVTLDLKDNIIGLYNDLKSIKNINVAFYRDNYTECYFLEIFASGVSKATGLNEIKKIIGADKVIAFGDNLNDIDMFRCADEAYAVLNACDELKAAATGIIGSNSDNSVGRFIYNHYLENSDGKAI